MPSSAGRVGVTINVSVPANVQRPITISEPMRHPVQMTEEQVKDPTVLAKQLKAMQLEMAETSLAARSHPIQSPVTFTNVPFGTGGAKTPLTHNFGRYCYFLLIGWRGAATTAAPVIVSDQDDTSNALTNKNVIFLRSYVAGTADVMLF